MKISEILHSWYNINKRSLPWRKSSDPYKIWLSEIILQQTRVQQGLEYYLKFTEHFPDVAKLSEAREEEVLNLWQGLGYYSRARNLLKAARQVMTEFGGQFPDSYATLLQLKGVGKYTAAAVASIAYDEPVAVVDGNVARVLSRLFCIEEPVNSGKGEKQVQAFADEILDRKDPGTHNQALMEFGALHCVPNSPDCEACVLQVQCMANKEDRVGLYPIKIKKGKVKERYFYYLVLEHEGYTYIKKRTGDDIWKSMYEFPLMEPKAEIKDEAELVKSMLSFWKLEGKALCLRKISGKVRHQLTHRTIYARFVHIESGRAGERESGRTGERESGRWDGLPGDWIRISYGSLGDYPLPRLIERYVESLEPGA